MTIARTGAALRHNEASGGSISEKMKGAVS
jgi:hypothetical protein